jgi:hypothetical protein
MTDERNPALERLFTAANRELSDEAFVAGVMRKTGKLNARTLVIAVAVCLVAAPVAWLLADPLNAVFSSAMQLISRPIAGGGDGDGVVTTVLPMNTVGSVLVLTLLALRAIVKRLFGENN